MCGIVGLAGVEDAALVERMARTLAHRGPDGEGFFVGDGVALGMRRLRIIDPAGSDQPIWNEDRQLLTVCNGEIYNYRHLRAQLEKRGHTFRTLGDVETIVHAHEEHGDAAMHLLRGMFAYALWDRRRRRLLLVRDRLGIKPLYYAQLGSTLAFASELRALLVVPGVSREIDAGALSSYLTLQYVPGPTTMLEGIRKLPPGHWLAWQDGGVEVRRYWDLVLDDRRRSLDAGAAAEAFRGELQDAVAHHQISDVPVGVLLSGGIDSSAVTALMAAGGGRVRTFSVGFETDGREEGELDAARAVARHCGTEHEELRIGRGLAGALGDVVRMQDEPIADPAAVPMYFVCRLAARSVKVVLTGEGGDELLGGYPRYGWLRAAERFRRHRLLATAGRTLLGVTPSRVLRRRLGHRASLLLGAASLEERHLDWIAVMSADVQRVLTGAGDRAATLALLRELGRSSGTGDAVHDAMYVDTKTWLPDDVLMKTDRMSMAASIEARVPLLDHRLVEFTAALPSSLKGGTLTTKGLLRRAVGRDLPASARRRRKRAFLVPLRRWLDGELRELLYDTVTGTTARARGLLSMDGVTRVLNEHRTGRADHGRALWTLLCLELWLASVRDAPVAAHD
ncbi:MAG TPA: asparagine synthase (glutamine-hydrolyzing) [Methylomirabilota bacterium]|nr:asparagine synthase (glutamine-hydrolyzing) [Methylomirabilota bacterium]